MSPGQRQLIVRLIKRYAYDSGTESMICRVAETPGMLDACRNLFDINTNMEPGLSGWCSNQCAKNKVNKAEFLQAVRQVLTIFNTSETVDGDYAVLGLVAGASHEEIKAAYRQLSLRHHPDRASHNGVYDPGRFVEINRAYHALTQSKTPRNVSAQINDQPSWDRTRKKRLSISVKKRVFMWTAAAVALLVVVIIFSSFSVRNQAMMAGLSEDRGAFIPPEKKVQQKPGEMSPHILEPDKKEATPLAEEKSVKDRPAISVDEKNDTEILEEKKIPHGAQLAAKEQKLSDLKARFEELDMIQPATGKTDGQKGGDQVLAQLSLPPTDERIDPGNTRPSSDVLADVDTPDEEGVEEVRQDEAEKLPDQQQRVDVQSSFAKNVADIQITASQPGPQPKMLPVVLGSNEIAVQEPPQKEDSLKTDRVATGTVMGVNIEQEREIEEPQVRLQQHIETFLTRYQQAYEKRNIINFMKFFASDAVENDQKVTEKLSVYREMFETTEKISLDITLLKWQEKEEAIHVDGNFFVYLNYKRGKSLSGNGPISFTLTKNDKNLLIKEIRYRFDD
jgi:hypothetical protein